MSRHITLIITTLALYVFYCVAVESTTLPNIIYIMTDDQDLDLGSMEYMPLTRNYIGKEGAEFTHFYVTTSLCCPSRTTFLTGQYCHNHKVWDNTEKRGGFSAFKKQGFDNATIAVWLKQKGYTTGIIGKYLNGYTPATADQISGGWDEWFPILDGSIKNFYNTCYSDNGRAVCKEGEYQTDTIRDKALEFIDSESGKKPFFLFLAPHAPHKPCTPAKRHEHLFPTLKAPRTPSWNASELYQKKKVHGLESFLH